ncbi:MAG TPA: glycine cleavage system aminomethyltransferase GcvT [Kiritimatiellia bacterium]|nr:glycine cleavage system aminomethyltransferase GcvT [Kiritimatiellia bacterium]
MTILRTPLFDEHRRLGAKLAPFGGWEMPIQYQGILAEHLATRTTCAMFDICHMGEIELSGPTAAADLERLLTLSVATLGDGQCRYGYLLRDDGGVLDDLTCYRFGSDRYWLVVNAATRTTDLAWIQKHTSPTTTVTDLSDTLAKIDVQGPTSRNLLARAGGDVPDLKYFHFAEHTLFDLPMVISRTGYTGEWGYELYFDARHASAIWNALLDAGIAPAGLGARDTLRLEVGYPLYGHELMETRTPVGASGTSFISLHKSFIGSDPVHREVAGGAPQKLVGLALASKRAARAGDPVHHNGQPVGIVTSGSLAPSLGHAVALAYIDTPLATQDNTFHIQTRGSLLEASLVPLPFYRHGTARRLPPPSGAIP